MRNRQHEFQNHLAALQGMCYSCQSMEELARLQSQYCKEILEDPELHAYKELHCYGYLTKPYDPEKLTQLLEDAMDFSHPREDNRNIYFKKDGIFFAKKMQDIVYIKSSAGKTLVKTTKDELEISYKSNSQIIKELDSEDFIRCSRSVIVNSSFIDSIDSTNRYVQLKNAYGTLEIGTIMKKTFLKEVFHE